MTTEPSILFDLEPDSGVGVLRLHRPARLNAFDLDMIERWAQVLETVERDPQVRALVVTGSGAAFCAGGDMDELASFATLTAIERKHWLWRHVHRIPLALERLSMPVIAAINGTARGAGLDMALMCDLRVMDATAVVAESYISLGLVPGDGGAWFLPRLIGSARALELLWTGDPVDAGTALRIGMVNRIAPEGQALTEALVLARRLAGQPAEAVALIKRLVYQGANLSLRAHLDTVSSHMAVVEDSPDFRTRLQAFRARRR